MDSHLCASGSTLSCRPCSNDNFFESHSFSSKEYPEGEMIWLNGRINVKPRPLVMHNEEFCGEQSTAVIPLYLLLFVEELFVEAFKKTGECHKHSSSYRS
jgi:hypothetical protein